MRRSCLECVAKHLGSAAVYIEEVAMGYPLYFGYVYGQLDHAASECLAEYPDLAAAIREHRIRWSATRGDPIEKRHVIPFEALFDYIDMLERVGNVEIPEEVLEGLPRNDDGKVVYSMDTRPTMNAKSSDANKVESEEAAKKGILVTDENMMKFITTGKAPEPLRKHFKKMGIKPMDGVRVQGDGIGKRKRKRRHRH